MPPYIIGFDPGYIHFGMGILDLATMRGAMSITDLTTHSGIKGSFLEEDIWSIVYDLVQSLKEVLEKTICIGIERQPPFGNYKVAMVKTNLESIIRTFFPRTDIYIVHPGSVRAYWKTHGKSYDERKLNSLHTTMLTNASKQRAINLFTSSVWGTQEMHVDAVEAMQLCIFLSHRREQLRPTLRIQKQPRVFDKVMMECDVHLDPATAPMERKSKYFKKSKYFL